jgi:TolB-like protein/DNA-binding winged helix-turn-helix (wHTH) protein/Tfp pilus assembly protein PilF
MPPITARIVRFGSFEVDTRTGELRKDGVRIKLQEKPFQLLLLLLEHQGDVVTRDQLREALWPADTFVDFDHSLGTAIAKLRTALGDSARSPRFVETVASRGYRFLAPLTPIDEPRGGVDVVQVAIPHSRARLRWIAASVVVGLLTGGVLLGLMLGLDVGGLTSRLRRASNRPVRSLAVLPLENLSRDPSQDYFVDGMTEQLITTVAQLQGVQVTSRTSAMQFKNTTTPLPEIGRQLNVDAVVEGSVLRSGQRIRITAQLIDTRTDQHLWAQSYERDLGDVLTLQDEIARSIANEIRVQMMRGSQHDLARSRTIVPAAQEAYLRARYHLNKGEEAEIRKSIDDFNEAIADDPADARSHAGLANAYVALTDFYERSSETMPRARVAAEHALTIDDTSAEAHAALGAVRFLYDWNFRGAEEEFVRATSLNTASGDAHAWYGIFLAQMGRFDEATSEIRRAESLDPLSVAIHVNAGWAFYLARRNAEALGEWRKALDLEPNLGIAHTSIWLVYAQHGATGTIAPLIHEDPHDTSPLNLATLAGIYATSGRRAEAETILARVKELSRERYVCPYEIATAHAALGQNDEAIAWLRKGVEDRSGCMPDLKVDPRFDALRSDPRFKDVLRRIGF